MGDTFDTEMDYSHQIPFTSRASSVDPGAWITRSGSVPVFNDNQSLPGCDLYQRQSSMDPIYFPQHSVTPMDGHLSLQSMHHSVDLKARYPKNNSFHEERYPQSYLKNYASDHSVDTCNTTVNTVNTALGGSISSNTILSTSPINEQRFDDGLV